MALLLVGCVAPQPFVWMDKGATLANYKVLEVLPAQNETGKTFDIDVGVALTEHLVSKLRVKNYTVSPEGLETQSVLTLKNAIVKYEASRGSADLIVRTALMDKKTGRLLGEFVTAHSVDVGSSFMTGLLIGPLPAIVSLGGSLAGRQQFLDKVAAGVVDELDKRIQKHD